MTAEDRRFALGFDPTEKPERDKPTETTVALDAARARLAKRGIAAPTGEQLAEEVEAGKGARAAETAAAIEKARVGQPNPPPVEQQKVRLGIVEAQDTLTEIKALVGRVNLAKLAGGIQPWINDIRQSGRLGFIPVDPANFGGPLSADEVQFLALLQDYADKVLRQRSGAQINEQEFQRMLAFLANPGVRPEVILSRLDLQERNLVRARTRLEEQWREFGFIVPRSAPPSATLGPAQSEPGAKPKAGPRILSIERAQ